MSNEQLILMSQLDDCIIIFEDDTVYIVKNGTPAEASFNED